MAYLTVGNGKLEASAYDHKGRSYVQIYAIGKRHINDKRLNDVFVVNMTSRQAYKLWKELGQFFGAQ